MQLLLDSPRLQVFHTIARDVMSRLQKEEADASRQQEQQPMPMALTENPERGKRKKGGCC